MHRIRPVEHNIARTLCILLLLFAPIVNALAQIPAHSPGEDARYPKAFQT